MNPRKSEPASPPAPASDLADAPSSVDPTGLSAYHQNPRKGNVDAIVSSLEAHGQYKPLIVNRGTKTGRPNEVLAGNHLLAAGLKLQLPTMLVHWLDVDDDEAARIVLVDNRASDLGGYDDKLLAEVLAGLPDLLGTGYNDGDLTRLLNGLGEGDQDGLTDPDAVPTVASETISVEGDVWLLGPHVLVCGDSTDVDVVGKAAEGGVHAMWTDPPYGVSYVGKTSDALSIQNDGADGLEQLLYDAFTAAATVLRPGAPCYIAHADTERVAFQTALENAGFIVRQNLIWVKNALVLGRSDYHYQHEPILDATAPEYSGGEEPEAEGPEPTTHEPIVYAFTPGGSGRLGRGGARWYGDNKQTTVFEVPKPTASRVHPTMKPTELIVQQLRNSVARGERVLDLFGGSGSTLIACHQLGLYARLVELDPRYVDVICRRYQEHTGIVPVLQSTGKSVTFVREGDS